MGRTTKVERNGCSVIAKEADARPDRKDDGCSWGWKPEITVSLGFALLRITSHRYKYTYVRVCLLLEQDDLPSYQVALAFHTDK